MKFSLKSWIIAKIKVVTKPCFPTSSRQRTAKLVLLWVVAFGKLLLLNFPPSVGLLTSSSLQSKLKPQRAVFKLALQAAARS